MTFPAIIDFEIIPDGMAGLAGFPSSEMLTQVNGKRGRMVEAAFHPGLGIVTGFTGYPKSCSPVIESSLGVILRMTGKTGGGGLDKIAAIHSGLMAGQTIHILMLTQQGKPVSAVGFPGPDVLPAGFGVASLTLVSHLTPVDVFMAV